MRMQFDQIPQLATLVIFSVNAVLVMALILLKIVHRRRMKSHTARRQRYLGVLSRHLSFENCTDPITAEMAEDPAFLDALIDMRNAISGDEMDTLHGIVNSHGVIERQIEHLDDPFPLGRRLRAAVALAELGDESAAEALMQHLDDREPEIRVQCARGLGRIQWTPAIEEIVWRFHVEIPWVRTRFSDTLTGFGAKATWPLLAYIRVNQRFETTGPALALRTLAQIQDHQAVGPILAILGEADDIQIEVAAVEALGEMGNPEAIPAMLQRLEADEWEIRAKAATALGGMGDPMPIPQLRNATRDPNWWVRRHSAAAIAMLPGGIETLYEVLEDHDPYAADAAAEALTDAGELVSARRRIDTGQSDAEPLLSHMGVGSNA